MEYIELICFIIVTLVAFYYIIITIIDLIKRFINFFRK